MEPDKKNAKDATLYFLSQEKNITAALATASVAGVPHSSIMYFAVDEDLNFYFLTATDTQKYKNLTENPRASLAIGTGPEYITVQADGSATILEKGSEAENQAIALLKNRLVDNGVTWPIFQLSEYDDNEIVVFKFTPDSMWYLNLEESSELSVTTDGLQKVI